MSPMADRALTLMDRLITEFDRALRTVSSSAKATRGSPAEGVAENQLTGTQRDLAARLMRVNHSGEIAAQALYSGQALTAREPRLRAELIEAAREEHDHLAWCEERTRELGARVSLLAPAWYAGSLLIGAVAGLAGDRASLGFLAETERQVTAHLDRHLQRLPADDARSRAIIERMRAEEIAHRTRAEHLGGGVAPVPIRVAMRATARIMTTVSHYI